MNGTKRGDASSAIKPARGPISPLRAGLWLAVVLVAAKAMVLGPPQSWRWLPALAMASFQDVLFAVAAGAVGELAARAAARRPALVRVVCGAMVGCFVLCAFYSVVAAGVFKYFDRPLNYDLLRLVRGVGTVRSSISERITVPMATALIGMPVVFLVLALWAGRRRRTPRVALAIALVWVAMGWWQLAQRPDNAKAHRMALSPHVELLRSTVVRLTFSRRPAFPTDFLPEDTVEFRSFGARGGVPSAGFQPPAGVARPRNAIVIVLESVGTKYLSLYGSRYETTPSLAAEATNALVFDNFHSNGSYTYFSFRSINFSMYPGLPWCYPPWAGREMAPTLASVLQARGWRTAYVNNGDLDWEGERWLLEGHGFDALYGYGEMDCPRLTSWGTQDRCLVDRLIRWIDEKRGQPFFAVCWTDQTHDPYELGPGVTPVDFFHGNPPPALGDDLSRYLSIIHETDRHLGRLFAALRERGLADDTLVVVTGDHGEAFFDPHDQRGHNFTIYQEEVNVPLLLWNPRLFAPGRRVVTVGAHVDMNPTIADILGVEPPGAWQGHSLFDPAPPERAFFLTNIGGFLFGVREGSWKYIFEATNGREMLFDLGRDPLEQRNAASTEPERCRRLRQRIAAWVSFEEDFLRGRVN